MAIRKASWLQPCRHGWRLLGRWVLPAFLGLTVAACATTPRAPAGSCLQRTVDALDLNGLLDSRKHCVASAAIAEHCGPGTAWLAGYAKEIADLLGPGAFERADLRADRAGRACAAAATQGGESRTMDRPALEHCCEVAGY